MLFPSTFSIVACDLETNACGVAVASKFPAVGAVVPWARSGAGAIATQAFANTSYGERGLDMLATGCSAEQTLSTLLNEDVNRETRQVGIVDMHGSAATFTGNECFDFAGGLTGPGYTIQGNILVGSQVIQAMQEAFLENRAFPERLVAAISAGDVAGGDRRGRQSAALYIVKPGSGYGGFTDRWMDYRVDDHNDPVARLGELVALHHLYFDKSPESERIQIQGEVLYRLQNIMKFNGYYSGPFLDRLDEATRAGLSKFMGNENFEERCDILSGWIDRPVFEHIMKKFGAKDA